MARIRSIKPEFFTSSDIVSLTPLARLFYVSLWCEADREGRLHWNPKTLKLRYFPADDCDIGELAEELVQSALIIVYEVDGKAYAEIPAFKRHQVINNREAESSIPQRGNDAPFTRESGVQGEGKEGRERKGKEGKGEDASDKSAAPPRGSRLPDDWALPKSWGDWALTEQPTWTADHVRKVAATFADHWRAQSGKTAVKLDWEATWRNWVRRDPPLRTNGVTPLRLADDPHPEFSGMEPAMRAAMISSKLLRQEMEAKNAR